jgi:hypothetical protein
MSSLELELAINKVGFYRSPNNIHSLPGSFWYAGGPGILTVPTSRDEIQIVDSRIKIIRERHEGEPYTSTFRFFHDTLAEFATVEEMQEWFKVHGSICEGGLPAFSNSWD